MTEIKTIENLLSQVNIIRTSYERVAQATGENFNIFSVLRIEHYEETTHSRFIAELLNPKGCHGKGVLFLEEFLEKIQMPEHLNLETTKVKTEHNIGLKVISGMKSTGGKIDIYLYDDFGKSISIENKIYAGDQKKQIVRYYNHNKGKNIVFYLTLFEDDTDQFSKGELKSNKESENDANFHCISYKININNWLSECQKIATDSPIVRETIRQYRSLIKKLTNQNVNSEMNKEILKLINQNEDYFLSLVELQKIDLKSYLIENIVANTLQELSDKYEYKIKINKGKWFNFTFKSNKLIKHNIGSFCFSSSSAKVINNIVYGLLPLDKNNRSPDEEIKIKEKFESINGSYIKNGYNNWIVCDYLEQYSNWEDSETLKKIKFDNSSFKDFLEHKILIIEKMLKEMK